MDEGVIEDVAVLGGENALDLVNIVALESGAQLHDRDNLGVLHVDLGLTSLSVVDFTATQDRGQDHILKDGTRAGVA